MLLLLPPLPYNHDALPRSFTLQRTTHPWMPFFFYRSSKVPVITSRIKWKKDTVFDNVIQKQKKLKLAMKLKDLLIQQPDKVMSLRELGKHRSRLGLERRRRCIAVLRKYPAVFDVFNEGICSFYFRFTPEAEQQFMDELKIRKEMEDAVVERIRKLLMMSIDKRILVEKLGHIRRELGLPLDFRNSILQNYPQFFKTVPTGSGPALELTSWDPELAVTHYEKKARDRSMQLTEEGHTISDRVPKFPKLDLPKGYALSRKDKQKLIRFLDMPFISPYVDFTQLDPSSLEAEKHAVAVVHELLSLTLEKRTLVDHLTYFRTDFKFSNRIRAMLIRHPEFFYVSLKGYRDSVFLRDAYNGSQLIEKDPLVLAKEKLGQLVAAAKKRGKTIPGSDDEHEREGDGEDDLEDGDFGDEDWSESEDENLSLPYHIQDEGCEDQQRNEVPLSLKFNPTALRGFREVDGLHSNRDRRLLTTPRERW